MAEDTNMTGRTAYITGASSGIGRATALLFARHGAKVAVADVIEEGGGETVEMIKAIGGEAIFIKTDVSRAADVERSIAETIAKFGGLDYAFNNAGIEGEMAPLAESTEENWDRVLAINLKGVWLGMKAQIPRMLENGGSIVNCASVAGLVGFPGLPAYCASKGGVVQLTRAAALEYAKSNIRVNAVCPGVIATPMVDRLTHGDAAAVEQFTAGEPVGRIGRPEEVAEAVVWLCSGKSTFVTGHPLVVDGGWVAQ
ncbi:MAG: SDR family oxidoreductase [Solirubrobacterales bacterium]